jgi:predicted house-cleaning noncanonical NTP pyrophosphatase (MazG superfamily)
MPVPYRKLVRDRIPAIIQAEGRHPVTRGLDEAGYRQALLDKLVEEAGEAARASAADLPGELADVLEVLRALTPVAFQVGNRPVRSPPTFSRDRTPSSGCGQSVARIVMVVAAASKRLADCASGRACQP